MSLTLNVYQPDGTTFRGTIPLAGPEPVIGGRINAGADPIQITMPTWPVGSVDWFDVVEVVHPDSTVLGKWRFYDWQGDEMKGVENTISLWPLAEELNAAFTGNYSDFDSGSRATAPILGKGHFDVPVIAALGTTRHCTVADVNSDFADYQLTYIGAPFGSASVRSTLEDATSCGGADWWWYCDTVGGVFLRGTARTTTTLHISSPGNPQAIMARQRHATVSQLFNRVPATGAYALDPGTGQPITISVDAGAGPYDIATIGLRVAKTLICPSARTVGTLTSMANTLLSRLLIPGEEWTILLRPGTARVQPGDKIIMVDDRASFTHDPMWVTEVRERDIAASATAGYATGVQEVVLDATFGTFHGNPGSATNANVNGVPQIWSNPPLAAGGFTGGLVAGGTGPTGAAIMTSPDGITWTEQVSPWDSTGTVNALAAG